MKYRMMVVLIIGLALMAPAFFILCAMVGVGGSVSGGSPEGMQLLAYLCFIALGSGITVCILGWELVEVRAMLEKLEQKTETMKELAKQETESS